MADTKKPLQERAQKTKELIARKGFQLILEKGLHNITTNDIADACGVSVGVIYRYYKDKRDILHVGVKAFFEDSLTNAMKEDEEERKPTASVRDIVTKTFEEYALVHEKFSATHAELEALRAEDEVLTKMYEDYEAMVATGITRKLLHAGMKSDHAAERVTIALDLLELYLNKYVGKKQLDRQFMKELVVEKSLEILEK